MTPRWSSTYLMTKRLLELRESIEELSLLSTEYRGGQTCFFYSIFEVKFSQFKEKVSRKIYNKTFSKKQCLICYNCEEKVAS